MRVRNRVANAGVINAGYLGHYCLSRAVAAWPSGKVGYCDRLLACYVGQLQIMVTVARSRETTRSSRVGKAVLRKFNAVPENCAFPAARRSALWGWRCRG